MKVSLITVVFNGERYLEDCIKSIISQTYPDIEYIVIDGGSTDGSFAIIERYKAHIDYFVSEKDQGMYDALNKGIKIATGDVVGILNADDMLASTDVIESVANWFQAHNPDALYGNLNYIDPEKPDKIVRKWISKPFEKKNMVWGWMPAHPTFYVKRELFADLGYYSLNFGSAADYELMLRFLYKNDIKTLFLDKLMVNMRTGGMSNASVKHRYKALINDYRALRANRVPFAFFSIVIKKISKLTQFIH